MKPLYFGDGGMLPIYFGDAAPERPSGIQYKKFTFCRRGAFCDTVTKGPPISFGDSATEWHTESSLLEGHFSETLVQCFLTHLGHASTERRRRGEGARFHGEAKGGEGAPRLPRRGEAKGSFWRATLFETSERGFAIYLSDPAAARPSGLQNA